MSRDDVGILACGAYVPRARLPATLVGGAHGWFSPSLKKAGDGRRSFCNWDEDSVTMAVEAARDCLARSDAASIGRVELASTTLPFADRSNAGLLREALDLPDDANLSDSGGSLRAASAATLRALENDDGRAALVIGSDCVETKPASAQEATHGHAAAAIVVGKGDPLARLKGSASLHQDFVDHYRSAGERFNYTLEARWTRDAGYRQQTRDVYARALADAGIGADGVRHVAVAAPPALAKAVARIVGATSVIGSELAKQAGFCGAAEPMLKLVAALQSADAGETVVLVSLGQGIDVLVFEIVKPCSSRSLALQLESGADETNYCRYLALRRLLGLDEGIRAERDNRTAQSAAWRKHESITGFKGGLCTACGTLQFPQSVVCVNCGSGHTQEPFRLADLKGRVRSFTEDWLAYTPSPPLIFGNVGFEKGANVMMEFTDAAAGEIEVGMPVELCFRIKDFDDRRQFRRYFWKPFPPRGASDG